MATAGKANARTRTATAAKSKQPKATNKKAEGVAARTTKQYVVNRTGAKGGKQNPSAVTTGARKVKSASGAAEAVGAEAKAMRAGTTKGDRSVAATARAAKRAGMTGGEPLGRKQGMTKPTDIVPKPKIATATKPGSSRANPVAKPAARSSAGTATGAGTSRTTGKTTPSARPSTSTRPATGGARSSGAKAGASKAGAKTGAAAGKTLSAPARSRIAARVSTGPKGGGRTSTAKTGGARKKTR